MPIYKQQSSNDSTQERFHEDRRPTESMVRTHPENAVANVAANMSRRPTIS